MSDIFSRMWNNLMGRITGPMNLRLIMQPLVAAGFAIWSGVKDAPGGCPAFLWTVVNDAAQRSALLRSAWKDVGKVFMLAVILDAIYQLIQLRATHLLELLIVAPILAFVRYVPFTRPDHASG